MVVDRLGPVGVWVVVFAFFVATTNLAGHSWLSLLHLARHGQKTAATVTTAHTSNHDGCEFTFAVGGRSFDGSREACGQRNVGDRLPVEYLPSNPSVNCACNPTPALRKDLIFALVIPTFFAGLIALRRRGSTAK